MDALEFGSIRGEFCTLLETNANSHCFLQAFGPFMHTLLQLAFVSKVYCFGVSHSLHKKLCVFYLFNS